MTQLQRLGLLAIALYISACNPSLIEGTKNREIDICTDGSVARIGLEFTDIDGVTYTNVNFRDQNNTLTFAPDVEIVNIADANKNIPLDQFPENTLININVEGRAFTFLRAGTNSRTITLRGNPEAQIDLQFPMCIVTNPEGKREVRFDPNMGRRR